jgi:hypothetical protein
MPSCAEPTAETAARKEGGCAMTRRACAGFALVVVLGIISKDAARHGVDFL